MMNRKNQLRLICQFLQIYRQSIKLSQEAVRLQSGIDVSHYESFRSDPSLSRIQVLCDYYGISFTWLCQITEATDSGILTEREYLDKARRVNRNK